jgi:hypothetical protein
MASHFSELPSKNIAEMNSNAGDRGGPCFFIISNPATSSAKQVLGQLIEITTKNGGKFV